MIEQHLKLFASLQRQGVEYLLIGGALAIAYGIPRVTKDIALYLKPTLENARRCLDALRETGMGTSTLTTAEEIIKTEITIFKDFLRVDLLTQVKGLSFEDCWKRKGTLQLDGVTIYALSLDDLIASKKATGRPGDLEDIKILEMARKQ